MAGLEPCKDTIATSTPLICPNQCAVNVPDRLCNICRLEDVRSRLMDAENLVLNLQTERKALEAAIVSKDDPLTRQLPVELSLRIFSMYVDSHARQSSWHRKQWKFPEIPTAAPLRLGSVSKRWRDIAWSSPTLWTTLFVNLFSGGYEHGPELVQEWLDRTSGLPIRVRLTPFERTEVSLLELSGLSEDKGREVLTVLNKFSPQIVDLDLDHIPFCILTSLKCHSEDSFCNLERLSIGNGEDQDDGLDENSTEMQVFRGPHFGPKPRALKLESFIPLSWIRVRWTDLVRISLRHISRAMTFSIIRECSTRLQVVELGSIGTYTNEDLEWSLGSVLELPAVTSLSYTDSGSSPDTCDVIFNSLTCPSLKKLTYIGHTYEPMSLDWMVAFVHRSRCSIKVLSMDNPALEDFDDLTSLLRQTPSLKKLNISFDYELSIDPLFDLLRLGDVGTSLHGVFLPNLRQLTLSIRPPINWLSFASIWFDMDSSNSQHSFVDKRPQISTVREDLEAVVRVKGQGELTNAHCIDDAGALLAILDINVKTGSNVVLQYDDTEDFFGYYEDLLEASFLVHFPIDQMQNRRLYDLMKAHSVFE